MYNPMDISRIDRQIDELQRLKANYQGLQQPQQPINNIITSQPIQPVQNTVPIFEAKFTNENPADILIQNKTAFIDLKNGKLTIKELDGELREYGLILPKDEKDLRIEELESKMKKLENSYNALLMQNGINSQIVSTSKNNIDNTPPVPPNNLGINETTNLSTTLDNSISNNDFNVNTINNDGNKGFKKSMFKQKQGG